DAADMSRAVAARLLGGEASHQIGVRRVVARDADGEEVEVEHVEALLDQGEIGAAVLAIDAEPGERLEPRRDDALAAAAVEVLDDERLALGVAQRAVAIGPAGGREQVARLAQVVAQ